MKKVLFFVCLILILSSCQAQGPQNYKNRFDDNPNSKSDLEMYQEHANRDIPDCHTLCYDKVQEVCVDEIVDILDQGNIMDTSLYNEEHCDALCNSKWSDDTRECIGKAKECDSLSGSEPYCEEEEDDSIIEYEPEQEQKYACSKACYKYKHCALKASDATGKDGNEAYRSCYTECQKWSDDTIQCVSNTETGTAMGCSKLSTCALQEYQKYLK